MYPNNVRVIATELVDGVQLQKTFNPMFWTLQQKLQNFEWIAQQLFTAVAYLRDKNVAHRDIKPENIMVNVTNKKLVLVDFGLSCVYGEPMETLIPELNCREAINAGTYIYQSPEAAKINYANWGIRDTSLEYESLPEETSFAWDVWSASLSVCDLILYPSVELIVTIPRNVQFQETYMNIISSQLLNKDAASAMLAKLEEKTLLPPAVEHVVRMGLAKQEKRSSAKDILQHLS
jgi:serine/threonine protein kinase